MQVIVDHEFATPAPAVDSSPFSNHGRVVSAGHVPDGRQPGSGALLFETPDSAVRIARGPVWDRLAAFAVEAWIKADDVTGRRNLVEADDSFALFINSDGYLEGSIRAVAAGASTPTWISLTSATHNPTGEPGDVPTGQWCKVVFHFDGLWRARLFLNDQLVALRTDFASPASPVAGSGVVIGNWTLASQYAFVGTIDRVRIFKDDPYAPAKRFTSRPVQPAARDTWATLFACLESSLNEDQQMTLRRLSQDWQQLLRELFAAVANADVSDRVAFEQLVATYTGAWRTNTIDDSAVADAVVALRDWIHGIVGGSWLERAEQLGLDLTGLWGDSACFDPTDMEATDPHFVRLLLAAAGGI